MKKPSIVLIVVPACAIALSLYFGHKQPPITISKAYLSGKEFVANKNAMMGSKHFTFIDTQNVEYYVRDKSPHGYIGTYSFNYDEEGKQYIKITEETGNLTVILLVKSPTELTVTSATPKSYIPTNAEYGWMNVSPPLHAVYELVTPNHHNEK